eukprot:6197203-Pleurochrysis_carterae.AAC.2
MHARAPPRARSSARSKSDEKKRVHSPPMKSISRMFPDCERVSRTSRFGDGPAIEPPPCKPGRRTTRVAG